jgi:hypothetical protein
MVLSYTFPVLSSNFLANSMALLVLADPKYGVLHAPN